MTWRKFLWGWINGELSHDVTFAEISYFEWKRNLVGAMESVTAPRALLRRGKRGAAAYVNGGCSNSESLKYLGELLDVLLSPETTIEDLETIEWCKWLMAGGKTPEEFSNIGKVTVYELHF